MTKRLKLFVMLFPHFHYYLLVTKIEVVQFFVLRRLKFCEYTWNSLVFLNFIVWPLPIIQSRED